MPLSARADSARPFSGMPRGTRRKKKRNHKEVDVAERDVANTPRCFVIKKGKVGERVEDVIKDLREVMAPNCAKKLKETKLNRLEDFMAVASHFHVSHILMFSATKAFNYMRIIKLPVGPTLTFKLNEFSTARDVRASLRKQPIFDHHSFEIAPIQIINGFGSQSELGTDSARQLTAEMLRGLLPPVDVPNFNQATVRRTALFNYDPEEDTVLFRHYSVQKKGMGLQRGIAKLMRTHRTLKLGNRDDIADFVLSGGQGATETEIEDKLEEAPSASGGKIGVKLGEIGPRMTLQLIKAEEGIMTGTVMYHRYNTKPPTKRELEEAKARQRMKFKKRNEMLEQMVDKQKAAIKKRRDMERKKDREWQEDREEWGIDAIKKPGDQTPGKNNELNRKKRGAKNNKDKGKGKGKGTGKGKADGAGKGKSAGKGKRSKGASDGGGGQGKNPRQKTLDRFNQSKKQRTS